MTNINQHIQTSSNKVFLEKLLLSNFRNYQNLNLNLSESPIVITGPNGAGKTNILEAVSFLSPGKGIRSVKLEEADRIVSGVVHKWVVSAKISSSGESLQVGTGHDNNGQSSKRVIKIEGEIIKSQAELAKVFSVMWLTPQMDGLFIAGNSDRRRFMDRLVYNFDAEHASRVYSYEYYVKERNRLLQEKPDQNWLTVLESKIAEKAISIAVARVDAIEIIQRAVMDAPSVFPKAKIGVEGFVENLVVGKPALKAEEELRHALLLSRPNDMRTGRTSIGTHRSDFVVFHVDKNMPASSCSTGEQKALLLSIILAEARAKAMWKNSVPVILLDEVISHLDEIRRHSLFEEIVAMGAQVFMTGTDREVFAELNGKAQFINIDGGVCVS